MRCCGGMNLLVSFFLALSGVVLGADYYQLLGIKKDADEKTIRKAFKKLAIQLHPDKNKDDEKAHERFVEINRAYEVLKDEELRKKYDLFGEEALKDGFHGGQNYQSWNFYKNNFGIYDDDPEVITLSRTDFDQSVINSESPWFINFYSPQCGHCHELAPAWRILARELDGAIRIGAVNCEEQWHLCREQGIFGYPSLLLYPQKVKYMGERGKEAMLDFVMDYLPTAVVRLKGKTFDKIVNAHSAATSSKPWIVDVCQSGEDCLNDLSRRKLAAMLSGLVTVAAVNCDDAPTYCEKLGGPTGILFYDTAEQLLQGNLRLRLDSLDAKEVAFAVLDLLPDWTVLDTAAFDNIEQNIVKGTESPWLIEFTSGDAKKDLELRKLPAMLRDIKVGRVNCAQETLLCQRLHIFKHPTVALFKQTGGHEIHYGRHAAHDIAGFAREAAACNLRSLGPSEFQQALQHTSEEWYIDFFTPWCPPCMQLLPEFRKASKILGNELKFGTIDCTIHQNLCQQSNVRSYPTTVLYNRTVPHSFVGLHSLNDLLTFVEDIRHPAVITLTPEIFTTQVLNRKRGQLWVVDFFAPWCGPCQELAPEFRKLAKMLRDVENVRVGTVDCVQYPGLCQENLVHSYPSIRLYPANDLGQHIDYRNWFRDSNSLRQWVYQYIPSEVAELSADDFHHGVLESDVPWLVDFYAPWCGHCQVFAPEFERIAHMLTKDGVKFGKINCDQNYQACQGAGVRAYPTLKLYRGVTGASETQNAYGHDVNSQDSNWIVSFLRQQLSLDQQHMRDEL